MITLMMAVGYFKYFKKITTFRNMLIHCFLDGFFGAMD